MPDLRACCVSGCDSNRKVANFKFCSNPVLGKKWLEALKLKRTLEEAKKFRVCIKHFSVMTDYYPINNGNANRLIYGSIPHVNFPLQSDQQTVINEGKKLIFHFFALFLLGTSSIFIFFSFAWKLSIDWSRIWPAKRFNCEWLWRRYYAYRRIVVFFIGVTQQLSWQWRERSVASKVRRCNEAATNISAKSANRRGSSSENREESRIFWKKCKSAEQVAKELLEKNRRYAAFISVIVFSKLAF